VLGTKPLQAYKTKWFARFARREGIVDSSLLEAIERAERGLIDADLGGGLIKQRVARRGRGRSGGYRVIVAYRALGRAVFLYAFAKNDLENIGAEELAEFRKIGMNWLDASQAAIADALEDGGLLEVDHD
jgi:hypothetical protein